MVTAMTNEDAQFIIATHSPILMALPGAVLYDFDRQPPVVVDYDDLGHVQFYRSFLTDPDSFLNRL
jgi:predicted ATPase